MSTEHQQYSTENQADVIREYAAKRGYEIIRTYADDGKSGLKIEGRASLRGMIDDVQAGNANFDAILVYDVSRWGRFQDTDESAYYRSGCGTTATSTSWKLMSLGSIGSSGPGPVRQPASCTRWSIAAGPNGLPPW